MIPPNVFVKILRFFLKNSKLDGKWGGLPLYILPDFLMKTISCATLWQYLIVYLRKIEIE